MGGKTGKTSVNGINFMLIVNVSIGLILMDKGSQNEMGAI